MEYLKLIPALATWRTIRAQGKTQNDIIATFCKSVIKQKFETIAFDEVDLQKELEEIYGFNLPIAKIKEVLSRILDILDKKEKYRLKEAINDDSLEIMNGYKKEYERFSRHLLKFIKSKSQNKIDEQEILNLFNGWLVDENKVDKTKNKGIFAYFADFFLHNEEKYEELLQKIKEGAILYDGLTYGAEKEKTTHKLTLFLDVEILFSAMGYNGEQYKKKFDEFYDLAYKYDDNSYGLHMPLFYNEDIKDEITSFFNAARKIKESRNANYKPTAAMHYLMNTFKDSVEIGSEESRFFHELEKKFKIKLYNEHSYDELLNEYPNFNLESQESLKNIEEKVKSYNEDTRGEGIQQGIKALNFINLIRRFKPKKFFEAKVFLITNTSLINMIAWDENIRENESIPLSTSLDFITARLWELLESSFGKKLKSTEPIFRIQILLKEMMGDNVIRQYERAKKEYENNPDDELFARELSDIQDKLKLEPNKENIETFEMMLCDEQVEEQKKLADIEKDKAHKLGLEKGMEIGKKEGFEKGVEQGEEQGYAKAKMEMKHEQKKVCSVIKRILVCIKKAKKIIVGLIVSIAASIIAAIILSCFGNK